MSVSASSAGQSGEAIELECTDVVEGESIGEASSQLGDWAINQPITGLYPATMGWSKPGEVGPKKVDKEKRLQNRQADPSSDCPEFELEPPRLGPEK